MSGSASTYVPLSFCTLRHLSTRPGNSCVCASSSSTSIAVEVVFVLPVFFDGCSCSRSNRTSLQLLRRVDVELFAGHGEDAGAQTVQLALHRLRQPCECVQVQPHTRAFDVGQDRNQRPLHIAVDRIERRSSGPSCNPSAIRRGKSARSHAKFSREPAGTALSATLLIPFPVMSPLWRRGNRCVEAPALRGCDSSPWHPRDNWRSSCRGRDPRFPHAHRAPTSLQVMADLRDGWISPGRRRVSLPHPTPESSVSLSDQRVPMGRIAQSKASSKATDRRGCPEVRFSGGDDAD